MGFYRGPNIVTDGLVLAVDAGSERSYPGTGTSWSNLVSSNYNGTLNNGTTFSTDNGGCMVFDGIDDSVGFTPSNSPGINNVISISAWVNCSNVATPNNIVSKNGPYFMRIVNSRVRFNMLTADTGWSFINGTTVLSSNVWYNFAMVYDGSTFKGYINGVEEFSIAKTGNVTSNSTLRIGYTTGGEHAPFVGKIASVFIAYSHALTVAEVLQNFNAQKSRFGL